MDGIWILLIIGVLAALIWGLSRQLGRGFPRQRQTPSLDSHGEDHQKLTNRH